MTSNRTVPLQWVPDVKESVLGGMIPEKLSEGYIHPSRLDVIAMMTIAQAQLVKCLFNLVGASIYHKVGNNYYFMFGGYNGPAKGDVDPREAGCARVVNGKLVRGGGLCRGTHAEMNALIANPHNLITLTSTGTVGMFVTLFPCMQCAKHIRNTAITEVYYLYGYDREEGVREYLEDAGISVVQYSSPYLMEYLRRNAMMLPPVARAELLGL